MLTGIPVDDRKLTPRAFELAHPELPQGLRETNLRLGPVARERWPLTFDSITRDAGALSGLSDFGDPAALEAVRVLCRSANDEIELNGIGRRYMHSVLVGEMVQRLRFEDLWKRHPEILDEKIDRPVFIVGLTRSGTTLLQHVLARNPAFRHLPFWESLSPLPHHDPAIRPPDDTPLIQAARDNVEGIRRTIPGLLDLHQLEAEEPEEEIYLFGPACTSLLHAWNYLVPSYARHLDTISHVGGYAYLKRILQTLQWMRGGGRWLLKSPQHVGLLPALLENFPDATIVEPFRDPVTATVSIANLCSYNQRIKTDTPDPISTGRIQVEFVQNQLAAFLQAQDLVGNRAVHAYFSEILADPLSVVRRIHEAADMELTLATEAEMIAFTEENRTRKPHRSEYAAEDFGIDIKALRENLRPYYDKFCIPVDDDI